MSEFGFDTFTLTYDEFQASVDAIQMGTSASELHGYQTGLVCLLTVFEEELWWEVLQSDYPSRNSKDADTEDLKRIYTSVLQTSHALEMSDCNFQLMVPCDDDSLITRVAALSEWCAGFFVGIQRALTLAQESIVALVRENPTILELLQDLEAIRQAETLELSSPEDFIETERNYAEVSEYVRVAAMNIYLEVCAEGLENESSLLNQESPNNTTHLH